MTSTVSMSSSTTKRSWIAVLALFLAAFVSLLDVTVVNLTLPRIARDLGTSDTQTQWILLAYLVPFASALLPFGRFGDVLGRRRLFVTGASGFAIGAMGAGTADAVAVLLFSRVIQGFAAAAMMPQVLALTHVIMPPEARPRAMGYFGMVSAMGAVAGPVIGGLVLAADIAGLGWRIVFLMSIPFCLTSLAIVVTILPKEPFRSLASLDIRNSVLIGISVALLVFPMVQGRNLEWPYWIIVLFPLAGLLGAHVIRNQLRADGTGRIPLLPKELLRFPPFLFGLMVMLVLFAGIAGVPFLLALYLQGGPGLLPLEMAMALVAHPVGATVAAYLAGRINPANDWLKPTVGTGTTLLGIVLVRHALLRGGVDVSASDLLVPLAFVGLGMGATTVSLFQSLLSKASAQMAGAASGMLQTAQQIGVTVSIAVVGAVYFGTMEGPAIEDASVSAAAKALLVPIALFGVLIVLCASSAVSTQKGLAR